MSAGDRYLEVQRADGAVIARRVAVATGFWARLRGLMLRPSWGEIDGLLLYPCDGVHTLLLRFAIEVVFLDGADRVVAVERLTPFRLGGLHAAARKALELPAGTLARTPVSAGDRLHLASPSLPN